MVQKINVKVEFPEKLEPLFEPSRYKILYGGRGGGKSWGIARALLVMGAQRKLRILCAREFQNSISESVHKLLSDQIIELHLEAFYEVLQSSIKGKNGTEFLFTGIRHNANKLKSYESIDIAWVEEAQNVSRTSWEILTPTIRADGSEIWASFNPELEQDETYQRFIMTPPKDAITIKMNWSDNPWFPGVLHQEMDALRERDEDAYLNIWEGHCRQVLAGAVYAKELRQATIAGRITDVPYHPSIPVDVFCDLGWADNTSLWYIQKVGLEYRCLQAYQNCQEAWLHYMMHMQSRGYVINTVWLPHDARAKSLGTGRSIEELTKAAGFKVRIVPQLSVEDGINALRTVFPVTFFDKNLCADGIQALRRYRYEVSADDGSLARKPLHDEASHFADGLRYFAVSMTDKPNKQKPEVRTVEISRLGAFSGGSQWMGR